MPGLRFYGGLFVGPRLRRGGAVRRPSVLGHRPKTLMPGAIHLSPADQIKGSPAGPLAPLGLAAKERWEHLTRLVELYK